MENQPKLSQTFPTDGQPTAIGVETEPIFSRIALSISGGGFRAAAYGLGTLNTLYLLGVLDNVHMVSTISGGTFAGAYYAFRRKLGVPFETIYGDFYDFLKADSTLPDAMKGWQRTIGETDGNYKLIRAFAEVYHQKLFQQTTFSLFWESDNTTSPFGLQTLIFGTTELYSGLAFRFQYSTLPETNYTTDAGESREWFFIGNGNIRIPHKRAQELRLADIVAASSCFPVGFESLNLPTDFPTGNPAPMPFVVRGSKPGTVTEVALIDGGVYDNQGIEGLLLANRRNRTFLKSKQAQDFTDDQKKIMTPSTLFLVADVASAEMGIYPPDSAPPQRAGRSLAEWVKRGKNLFWWAVLLAVIGLLIGAALSWLFSWGGFTGGFIGGFFVGLAVVVGAIGWGIGYAWKLAESQLMGKLPDFFPLVLPPFRLITVKQLMYLLTVRLKTAVALLLSVFLRRVRSLNYGLLYRDDDADGSEPGVVPDVMASIIGGIIRDLDKPNYKPELAMLEGIIRKASSMSTTLWWLNEKSKMNSILACAEITLTWRIKRLIARKQKAADDEQQPFVLSPVDTEVLRRANLIFETFQLANGDPQKPTTYPDFRLYPGMKPLIDQHASPAELIDFARKQPN